MCKQKPSSQSSRQGNVDVSSTSASSTTTTTSSTMPSVGACYKGEKKMVTQHRLGSTNLVEEQLFSNSNKPETDFQGNSCAMDAANSATVDPWSPAIMSDVVPDPYCPRRIAVNSEKHCLLPTDLTCGSEESLIPQSESSCDGASAAACSSLGINTELDLIRFSPASGVQIEKYNDDDGDDDDDDDNDNDIIMRRDSCVFSCDKVKFDDELSDADEYEDAIDSFNLDPFPFRGNIDVVPFSIALPSYNRADMNLSREASDLFLDVILPKSLGLPQVKSAAEISVASSSISQKSMPICRICHLPATEEDRLMSPCRCSGTMRFIHTSCLMKWLEITSNRSKRPPSCELCLYQYHRHKKFKVRQWQFPQCSRQDKVLHIIFIASLIVMLGCATATILCFKQDRGLRNSLEKSELTKSEVITLVCGVFFFVAFFVAMYVEVKSRNTIYKLCVKFVYLNQQWYIDEYDKRKDVQPVPV